MGVAETGTRSFFLSDYVDEVMPCEPSLEGWAEWLGKEPERYEDGETEFGRDGPAKDGEMFAGSAILWGEDVVARRTSSGWKLSRVPDDDAFVAVRFGEGAGWSSDNLVWCAGDSETMAGALVRFFEENADVCEDVEYVAVGMNEDGWRFTFHSGPPPRLDAERVN